MWKLFGIVLVLILFEGSFAHDSDNDKPDNDYMVYVPDKNGIFHWVDTRPGPEPDVLKIVIIKFFLYTRANKEEGEGQRIFIFDEKNVTESHFNSSHPTRVLIHGWMNDGNSYFGQKVKDAYLEIGDYNVIVVDWSDGSEDWDYIQSKEYTFQVGEDVGRFINKLVEYGVVKNFLDVDIVGHSLGAHTAGVAARTCKSKVNVVYGLDPAGPLYSMSRPWERLNKNDSRLTITVRTNMGWNGLGFDYPLGMIDFLPNGGEKQPGCGYVFYQMCSHSASYKYFIESLKENNFMGISCSDFDDIKKENCHYTGNLATLVGENFDFNTHHGYYYFKTSATTPYGLGPAALKSYESRKNYGK